MSVYDSPTTMQRFITGTQLLFSMNSAAWGEAVETFASLGLNLSQARVYLALVENGVSTAQEISTMSGVNRQEIYRIMPKLQEIFLVEKIISKPIKWKATPIQDGVSILMEHRKNEISELQAKATKIITELKRNKKRAAHQKDEPQFIMMPGKDAHLKWLNHTFKNVQKTNDSILTWNDYRTLTFLFEKELKQCSNRAVKTRLIIYVPERDKTVYKSDQTYNINDQKLFLFTPPLVLGGLFDTKELVIATEQNDPIKNGEKVFWSNNPSLIALFQNYFEQLWKRHANKHERRTLITATH